MNTTIPQELKNKILSCASNDRISGAKFKAISTQQEKDYIELHFGNISGAHYCIRTNTSPKKCLVCNKQTLYKDANGYADYCSSKCVSQRDRSKDNRHNPKELYNKNKLFVLYSKQTIKEKVQSCIKDGNLIPSLMGVAYTKDISLIKSIEHHTSFLNNPKSFAHRVYHIINDTNNTNVVPKCFCGNAVSFYTFKAGYKQFCSSKCNKQFNKDSSTRVLTSVLDISKAVVDFPKPLKDFLKTCLNKNGEFAGPKAKTIPQDTLNEILEYYESVAEAVHCEVQNNKMEFCVCGKRCTFISTHKGYTKYCSKVCGDIHKPKFRGNIYKRDVSELITADFTLLSIQELKDNIIKECSADGTLDTLDAVNVILYENNNADVFNSMNVHFSFMSEDSFSAKVYCLLNDISEALMCPQCNTKRRRFIKMGDGFTKYCSSECSYARDKSHQKKRDVYGKTKHNISLLTKEYIQDNLLNAIGAFNTQKFKKLFWTDDITLAYNIYHNTTNPKCLNCEGSIKKIVAWGYGYRDYCGVTCASSCPDIRERSEKASRLHRDYTMTDGSIIRCQGFEPFYLDLYVNSGADITDISRGNDLQIKYKFHKKTLSYFPDFYIKSTNTVVEIKSTRTLELGYDKNIEKFKRTEEMGYNFVLVVFNNKGQILDIHWDSSLKKFYGKDFTPPIRRVESCWF